MMDDVIHLMGFFSVPIKYDSMDAKRKEMENHFMDRRMILSPFSTELQNIDAFSASFAGDPRVTVSELCRSRAGRSVPRLRLREGEPAQTVLFTCRHHAQESMASFALEGAIRALASDEPWARDFRRSFEVLAVPFVDRDGVEDGTQGKCRIPHDHNRDYGAPGGHLYPECAAIERILDERRPPVVLDLHCPWIRGGDTNESPYLVQGEEERTWAPVEVGKNSKVKYVEKHYGEGDGRGKRILNPVTEAYLEEGSSMEMEMVQIKGVDSTVRTTKAELAANASLVVRERLMTHGNQKAKSIYETYLNGDGAAADVVSRSVAREESFQEFSSRITGNAASKGHTECDAIIMDKARVLAIPQLDANNVDAALVHEAAIGKIAGEQIIKLMTLGLTQEQAEEQIINGFLK